MMSDSLKIRSAAPSDTTTILAFITKKSEFDRHVGAFTGSVQTTEVKIRQTIFAKTPFAHVLIAETARQSVGYALYYFRYSSFAGQPSIWLDDLFVEDNMRSRGIGDRLMNCLARIAKEKSCSHIAWTADARNTRGISFYHRLGAKITETKQNTFYFKWATFIN